MNQINPECEHKNLLDRMLQWPTLTLTLREATISQALVIGDSVKTTTSTRPTVHQGNPRPQQQQKDDIAK